MTGVFVTIDGPGGCGKTATVAALADELRAAGHAVHTTAEPSAGPIGTLTRALVDQVSGYTLACLVAADRYHHLDTEIRPEKARGQIVICDRYLASTLVLQRRDGLPGPYLLAINDAIDLPDLAVILTADPQIITGRLQRRGHHDRFEDDPGAARTETALFAEAAATLASMGVNVCHADTSTRNPRQVARQIISVLTQRCATVADHG